MRLGWDAVTLKGLRERFVENGLDELARALVRVEARDRSATIRTLEGPAPAGVRDGGREVEVELAGAPPLDEASYLPKFGLASSFLGDASLVAVSCKTGRDVAGVRKDALKDAKGDDGGDRAAEVLRLGGRLVLMTTQAFTATTGATPSGPSRTKAGGKAPTPKRAPQSAAGKPSLIAELAEAYAARTGRSPAALREQVAVVDGNDLVEYMMLRKPLELGDALLKRLGVEDWPTVLGHRDAVGELEAERTLPDYLPDGNRMALSRQIAALIAESPAEDGALCVVGPPGVGKTRCVLESLNDDAARVIYVVGDAQAQRLLEDEQILLQAPSGILVVDDARPDEVGSLYAAFRRARPRVDVRTGGPSPRLIVIVPAGTFDPDSFGRIRRVQLGPLSEREARELVATTLGEASDGARASQVFRVTGGYPWFGILVAQEITAGSAVPMSTTAAAKLAIAPDAAGREPRLRRARALLAAMIVREARWDDLDDSTREGLARAVDLATRRELNEEIAGCAKRGVLRRDAFLYVTPAVLEREVWRILRDDENPTDPGAGDRRLLQRIRSHIPDLAAPLIDRLRRLDLSVDELGDLARVMLEVLRAEVVALGDLASPDRSAMLSLCAHGGPEEAGRWLGALVLRTNEETLQARADLRRLLVASLDAIARRGAAFEAVEAALFALRLAENEAYSDNASARWESLFIPELDVTSLPLALRLSALEKRCLKGDTRARVSAIRSLRALLQGGVVLHNFGEKPLRRLGSTEWRPAREALCRLLLQCVADRDASVTDTAQRVLVAVLLTEKDSLTPLLDRETLARAVANLAEPLRASLRRELELAQHRDRGTSVILAHLDELTRPQDYAQRLRDQLTRAVVPGCETADLDEALVREGLAPPDRPLLRHIDLLEEDDADRMASFAVVAGRVDVDCQLLAPLVRSAVTGIGASALVAYCLGHYEAGRRGQVLDWLASWRDDPRLTATILVTAARCGGSEALMRLALETLREREVAPATLRYFATSPWRDLSDETLRDALRLLVDRFGAVGASVALRQLQHQLQQRDGEALEPLVLEVTSRAAAALAGADAWAFEQCLRWLFARGRVSEVSETLLSALAAERLAGQSFFKLSDDVAARSPAAFWAALQARLELDDGGAERILTRLAHSNAGSHLPHRPMLDWVGLDESRARQLVWLVPLDDAELSPLAAGLIERFGATSRTARALSAALEGTPRPVSSLSRFYEVRRDRAREWSQRGSPAVREWAAAEALALERRREWYAADETAERRRFGT
ncbi:MAG: hypothetical protein Q8S73_11725 [Deltaproteobacteria bacterium]|nr:hypothetical protein [Myxococcales bacterium]MDP3214767.1 hypothetical protein [Deltaproteobacteria bacterium]